MIKLADVISQFVLISICRNRNSEIIDKTHVRMMNVAASNSGLERIFLPKAARVYKTYYYHVDWFW